MELSKKIDKAKLLLMSSKNTAFICHILFSMPLVENKNIPTAQVDRVTIEYNPDWLNKWSFKKVAGLLAHEAWHVGFNHFERVPQVDLNREAWACAIDIAINNMLIASGTELPDDGIWENKYIGWSTLAIYEDLKGSSNKNPWDDVKFDEKNESDEDSQLSNEKHQAIVNSAIGAARQAGQEESIPTEIKDMVIKANDSSVNWNDLLQEYMQSFAKEDYSYIRTNRRYMDEFTLPTLSKGGIDEVSIYLDVSGSVVQDAEVVNKCLNEVAYIKEFLSPNKINLYTFDLKIHKEYNFTSIDSLEDVEISGGGGTLLEPVLTYKEGLSAEFNIVITDGYFHDINVNDTKLSFDDIIWVIYDNKYFNPKTGKIVHIT